MPDWLLHSFAVTTGFIVFATSAFLLQVTMQLVALGNLWSFMPLKIKIGTLLIVTASAAWSCVLYRFKLEYAVYWRECGRRTEVQVSGK